MTRNPRLILVLLLLLSLILAVPAPTQEKPENKREVAARLLETADQVMEEVSELRGWPYKRPVEKGVHNETELRAYLKKQLLEDDLGEGKLEQHQWMLTSLGFLPAGMDLADTILNVLLSQVGGFYDPEQNSFFMMEQAAKLGDFLNRTMIAHELTHALDDQYFDLHGLMKDREDEHDSEFAIGSVVEGSATALMTRWTATHRDQMDLEEMQKMVAKQDEQNRILLDAPLYFSTLVARYMLGMSFLLKGEAMPTLIKMPHGVADNLRTAMENVPVSSEQILHPAKYWDPDEIDLPVTVVHEDALTTQLAKVMQCKLVAKDTLGEIHCAILSRNPKKKLNAQLMMSPNYWTSKAARGWGGDRAYLFSSDDSRGILWCTWWDTEKDCTEFRAAYQRYFGDLVEFSTANRGRLAIFTYGAARIHTALLLEICEAAATVKGDQEFALVDPK